MTSPRRAVAHARSRMRRAAIKGQLSLVAAGRRRSVRLDLRRSGADAAGVIWQMKMRHGRDSMAVRLVCAAFMSSGLVDATFDGLGSSDPALASACARLAGALELEEAVQWIAPLLNSRESSVADAAARALGRIGGVRAADALLQAVRRQGSRRVLIGELAKAAPDLYLESVLSSRRHSALHSAAALAAGLRRRHVATVPLLALLITGTRRQRAIGCRALGWIGARAAAPMIEAVLDDRESSVRVAAAKALAALRAPARFDSDGQVGVWWR